MYMYIEIIFENFLKIFIKRMMQNLSYMIYDL